MKNTRNFRLNGQAPLRRIEESNKSPHIENAEIYFATHKLFQTTSAVEFSTHRHQQLT
jgi:hypothetical protein